MRGCYLYFRFVVYFTLIKTLPVPTSFFPQNTLLQNHRALIVLPLTHTICQKICIVPLVTTTFRENQPTTGSLLLSVHINLIAQKMTHFSFKDTKKKHQHFQRDFWIVFQFISTRG